MTLNDLMRKFFRSIWVAIIVGAIVLGVCFVVDRQYEKEPISYTSTKLMSMTYNDPKGGQANTDRILLMINNGLQIWNNEHFYNEIYQRLQKSDPDLIKEHGITPSWISANFKVESALESSTHSSLCMHFNVIVTADSKEVSETVVEVAACTYTVETDEGEVRTNLLNEYFRQYDPVYQEMLVHDGAHGIEVDPSEGADNRWIDTVPTYRNISKMLSLLLAVGLALLALVAVEAVVPRLLSKDRVSEILNLPCIGEYRMGKEDKYGE